MKEKTVIAGVVGMCGPYNIKELGEDFKARLVYIKSAFGIDPVPFFFFPFLFFRFFLFFFTFFPINFGFLLFFILSLPQGQFINKFQTRFCMKAHHQPFT